MIPEIIRDICQFMKDRAGNLAVVEGRCVADGRTAYVLCIAGEDDDGFSLVPIGELRADAGTQYVPHPEAGVDANAGSAEIPAGSSLKTFKLDVGEE